MLTSMRAKERVAIKFDCAVVLGDGRRLCTIRNISRNGVLTSWRSEDFVEIPFRVGEHMQLEISVSEHPVFGPKQLRCMGRITRVEMERKPVAFQVKGPRLASPSSQSSGLRGFRTGHIM
jgi:PilZ domain